MRVFALLIVLAAAKDVQVPEELSQSNCQGCYVRGGPCKKWDAEKNEFCVDCNLQKNKDECSEGGCIAAPAGRHTACSKCDAGIWVPNSDPAVENEWCMDCTLKENQDDCVDAGCIPKPPPPTPTPAPPGCIRDRFACDPDWDSKCCPGSGCAKIVPAGQGQGYMCVRNPEEAVAVSYTPAITQADAAVVEVEETLQGNFVCIDKWKRCTDRWCMDSCNHKPSYCPRSYCRGAAVPAPPPAPPAPKPDPLEKCPGDSILGTSWFDENNENVHKAYKLVCCPSSCGDCAGDSCAKRPGGAKNCCGRTITVNQTKCGSAPCVLGDPPPADAAVAQLVV